MKETADIVTRKLKFYSNIESELKIKQLTQELSNAKDQIKTLSNDKFNPYNPSKSHKNFNLNNNTSSKCYSVTDYTNNNNAEREREREQDRDREHERERDRKKDSLSPREKMNPREKIMSTTPRMNDSYYSTGFGNKYNQNQQVNVKQLLSSSSKGDEYAKILSYNNSFLKKRNNNDS